MRFTRPIQIVVSLALLLHAAALFPGAAKADGPAQKKYRKHRPHIKRKTTASAAALTLGVVENKSHRNIWITADNKKYCLKPGESSTDLNLNDADGLLLDGTPVLFDSTRTDLGGGKIWNNGAIKVCDPGKLTVVDGLAPAFVLKASISLPGFLCPNDSAGYKTVEWCGQHPGWDINTAPLARPC